MNLLRAAAEQLQDKFEQHASEDILYRRNKGPWIKILACPAQHTTEQDSGNGFTVRTVQRDFIVRQTRLAEAGFEPARPLRQKDEIQHGGSIFVVNSDTSESHYGDTDPYNVAWRIHTTRDVLHAPGTCKNR